MPALKRAVGAIAIASAVLTGCAGLDKNTAPAASLDVTPFSRNRPGSTPRGWTPWIITRTKAATQYELVVDAASSKVVLQAQAHRAATGLRQRLDVDPLQRPHLRWQWRVLQPIEGADVTNQHADDAPVRLLLFFDGDVNQLPLREQMLRETAKLLTGQSLPYATLMYVWDSQALVGEVLSHGRSQQIKMVVAGGAEAALGQWHRLERNYVADYQRAFNQAPGRLIGIGVLTDTDNTGTFTESYYGDIELVSAPSK